MALNKFGWRDLEPVEMEYNGLIDILEMMEHRNLTFDQAAFAAIVRFCFDRMKSMQHVLDDNDRKLEWIVCEIKRLQNEQ